MLLEQIRGLDHSIEVKISAKACDRGDPLMYSGALLFRALYM